MELLIASHNEGKIREFRELLEPLGYSVLSAKDYGISMDAVIEDQETFRGNARLKSKYLSEKTGLTVISDDSGLVIDALPDILGVKSARFMGEDTSYELKNNEILRRLDGVENRSARFHCAISLYGPKCDEVFEGVVEGAIGPIQEGGTGFGYDPIFYPEGSDQSFGTMSHDAKNKISHRGRAVQSLLNYLRG
ncbi:RdgB/HAM1 family non-canonical purine NTP pyrophosphatase [Erysipelothrix rhusiopathiae]|uniref:RdgB/HAM1 family non-canonical purine NTP pyrophosphatase n=1 Tax=Erysipelothrix rhusiopathiae TaxID=1648 RepID=UPI002B24D2DD|nr:RdgB/HAM1 family non-canonical purine NTP pyrophosphatase [Erysipelothrix rhusiopathiae]WRB92694.1 RdgB/HAM1 family non-canonical purine NTP pyrophosphatase [Erysipelothrix rhusiopathiae]